MENSDIVTLHAQIFGKVHGVFFRDYTKRRADELDLAGWVRNCPDGTVEAVISGTESSIRQMVEWFHQGSPYSHVDKVIIGDTTVRVDTDVFEIKFTQP